MSGMNICNYGVAIGRLVHPPKIYENRDGSHKVRYTLAVKRDFKSREGKQDTDFIDLEAFLPAGSPPEQSIYSKLRVGTMLAARYVLSSSPLALSNESIRASLGVLFTWKSCMLLGLIVLAVFFYRPFCKWICPLGALYALFNRISLWRLSVDKEKCTACGACAGVCKMDVDVFRSPNHTECIRCGDCIRACPTRAIRRTPVLPAKHREKEFES